MFSNGLLDPWSSGGVLQNISESLVAVIIPEGAHHLDVRAALPSEPCLGHQVHRLHESLTLSFLSRHSEA